MQRFFVAQIVRLFSWIKRERRSSSPQQDFSRTESGEKSVPLSVGWLFFVSLLLGILLKLVFSHFVTIGYDDYHVINARQTVNLVELQEKTLREGGSLAYVSRHASGPLCRDSE
jgi:hypothetical protein